MYRANCDSCGEVVIRAEESSVHVAGPQTSWQCTFRCPVCRRDTLWPVPAGASYLLVAGGAQVTLETVPATIKRVAAGQREDSDEWKRSLPDTDRKLQLDDVIDFHELLLSDDDWWDQLVQSADNPKRVQTPE